MLSLNCFGLYQLLQMSHYVVTKHLQIKRSTMNDVNPIYSNGVSRYFTQLTISMIMVLISIIFVNQNGFVLHGIIHTYIIMIITNTINNNSIYKLNQIKHICYTLNNGRIFVYRSNTNGIFGFMITRYDEFDANPYKLDISHTIHNKKHNFDLIVCIITVFDSIIPLIKLLRVVIQSIIDEIFSFIYISVNTKINVVLMILNYQFNAKIDTMKVVCSITKRIDDFNQTIVGYKTQQPEIIIDMVDTAICMCNVVMVQSGYNSGKIRVKYGSSGGKTRVKPG